MNIIIIIPLFLTLLLSGGYTWAQQDAYEIIKTGNAFIVKSKNYSPTSLEVSRTGLDCSTASLNEELNFSKIKGFIDEEMATIFLNIKIQVRVYIDFQGEINNVYFISENDPSEYPIDYGRIEEIVQRKYRVENNKNCLPIEENRYISWYIPLFEL
ncbi:MAG: hypothetical protein WD398_12955 [Cyclobacteriaceae bacterium]